MLSEMSEDCMTLHHRRHGFCGFSQSLQVDAQIRPQLLSSKSYIIHYVLLMLYSLSYE
jgi:hypothetical protein